MKTKLPDFTTLLADDATPPRPTLRSTEEIRRHVQEILQENSNSLDFTSVALYASGYGRVSCDIQLHDGTSLEDQEARITEYIKNQGWVLVEYISDPALSGRNSRRPGFRRLQRLVRDHRIQILVVDRIDRLARHLSTFLEFIDLLQRKNVKLISLREGIDYRKPWGKLVLYILGALAEFYSDNLSQEIRIKRMTDAANGKLAPTYRYGYCIGNCLECTDPNGKDYCPYFGRTDRRRNAFRVPHPVEAVAVRLMFEWYATGNYSYTDIAQRLNEEIFALPDGVEVRFRTKGRPGLTPPAPFNADAVRVILSNPIYAGQVTYAGSDETRFKFRKPRKLFPSQDHQALISAETFERVQLYRKLRAYRVDTATKRAKAFPLSRLLFCADHHSPMRSLSSRGYRYYADRLCQEKYNNRHQDNIKADLIEDEIRRIAGALELPEAWIQRTLAYVFFEEGESALMQDRLALRQQLDMETYLMRTGRISPAEFGVRYTRINNSLQALEISSLPESREARMLLDNLPELIRSMDPLEENAFYRSFIAAVYLHDQQIAGIEVYPVFAELHPQFRPLGSCAPLQGYYPQP